MALTKEKTVAVIGKYGATGKDTGNTKVQVALLTERITELSTHCRAFKKDKSASRGLIKLIGQRRSLLKYLQRRDIELYRTFIKEIGLRK
jgi:small subunit ribosomal protein S15